VLWPDSAKTAISDAFYDKEVAVSRKVETVNVEGGSSFSEETKGTFTGNVRFNALGELQEELGLIENVDIAITCDNSTDVAVDDLLQYRGRKYVATNVLPYDSHKLIVGQKWRA